MPIPLQGRRAGIRIWSLMKEQSPMSKKQTRPGNAAFPGETEPAQAWLYVQHPESGMMGDMCIPGTPGEPRNLSPGAVFIWRQLETPRTKEEVTAAFREKFGQQSIDGKADLGDILQQLTRCGLAIAIAPGNTLPRGTLRPARRLLSRAFDYQREGDWPSAIALCLEAQQDPVYSTVAELNVLIGRFHAGQHDGLIQQARELSAMLPPLPRCVCLALILLAAHRTQQWPTARETALELEARVQSPWDLPCVPIFAVLARGVICVNEQRSPEPIFAVIDDLRARCEISGEQEKALDRLVQRYKQRED